MARTTSIITARIGEGGRQSGNQVLRIKQLLRLNGFKDVAADDHWDKYASRALVKFRERTRSSMNFELMDGWESRRDDAAYVTPNDPLLFELAYQAGVLIRLEPPLGGADAFLDVHEWLVKKRTGFDTKRVLFGWDGLPSWAVLMTLGKDNGEHEFGMSATKPLELNCTLYANLMMSVWLQGNVHSAPFEPGIAESGGAKHLAVFRYHYKLRGSYASVGDVTKFTDPYPNQLFCIEAGNQVSHMALLLNDEVFQCNIWPFGCSRQPLERFIKLHPLGWISGPAPGRP